MQNTSLEHINPANLKKFVRKLSIVSSRHENKQSYKINPKEKKLLEIAHQEGVESEGRQYIDFSI